MTIAVNHIGWNCSVNKYYISCLLYNMHLNNRKLPVAISFFAIAFSLIRFSAFAQENYEPKILVLAPAKTSVSPNLANEFKAQSDTIAKMVAQLKASRSADQASESQAKNLRLMVKNAREFLTNMDFFKQVSYISQSYLSYRFYERFTNELILLKDTVVSPQINDMQKLAKHQDMEYILSFPTIDISKENKSRQSKIRVQLYERTSNSFLIDKVYIGDQNNHGFEFTCSDGTINCTINNALSGALKDIVKQVATNNPTLKRERELTADRARALQKGLFNEPYDITLLKQIIPSNDSSINLNTLYHCLYNPDKTQFVAFFTETGISNSFKTLHDKTDKGKISIITSKDVGDPGYLDSMPKTYAYIVKGVKYNGKWYYQKDEITYFDAPTLKDGQLMYFTKLEGWKYFKENSTDYSSEFWSGPLFERVVDRTKDPKWEKYKDMWETEERENRDYIGLFDIVADRLKEGKKAEAIRFQQNYSKQVLDPFFSKQAQAGVNHIKKFDKIINEFVLIYPKDKHVILTPLKVSDEKGDIVLRFFVSIPGNSEIYEWTYFSPTPLKSYPSEGIIQTLGTLTKWNFAYSTLDDTGFWNKYILAKEGSRYKYLKALSNR